MFVPCLLSRPRYQPRPPRQAGLPFKLLLKVAMMSSALLFGGPGARSAPASRLASATWYHMLSNSRPGKLAKIWIAPAEPSVAAVAVQVSGLNAALILISTALGSVAPQMSAAAWNAI